MKMMRVRLGWSKRIRAGWMREDSCWLEDEEDERGRVRLGWRMRRREGKDSCWLEEREDSCWLDEERRRRFVLVGGGRT